MEMGMWNPFDFTGKRFIVTGAASGIGRATAIRLSEQGAEVCLMDRAEETLQATSSSLSGRGHRYYIKDLSRSGGMKEIYDDIVSDGHKIDGIVYCAGMVKILPAVLLNKAAMDESMTVNLYSFVEMAGLLSKRRYHDKASIVGVSSVSVRYPKKCQGIYLATKSAMNAMVGSLAIELAEKGIRINTVLPSNVDTPMMGKAYEDKTEREIKAEIDKQLLGLERPEDIADIILFLLSGASRMITGREIYADGGYIVS